MASSTEVAWYQAVMAAEGVRQTAYANALATYTAAGFTPAAMATYTAACVTADIAFSAAVNTASTTAGIITPCLAEGGLSRSPGPSISATIIS